MVRNTARLLIAGTLLAVGNTPDTKNAHATQVVEFRGQLIAGNGITVMVEETVVNDVNLAKSAGHGVGTMIRQAKIVENGLGTFKKKVVIEVVADVFNNPTVKVTGEEIIIRHSASNMGALDTAVTLVLAHAVDLGAKDPQPADPAILATTFNLVLSADEEPSIAAALKRHGTLSKRRLTEYNSSEGPKLTEDEATKLPGTLWLLARYWEKGLKQSLADFVVTPADKLPDPRDAYAWYTKG